MQSNPIKLASAQWILERVLSAISAAETKVGAIIAIESAASAGLAAAFSAAPHRTLLVNMFSLAAMLCILLSFLFGSLVFIPRIDGPKKSRIYFGRIAQQDAEIYVRELICSSEEEVLIDIAKQIHRNSEIAVVKYNWVRRSMAIGIVGVIPWVVAFSMLIRP